MDMERNLVKSVVLGYTEKNTILEPKKKMLLELVAIYDMEGNILCNNLVDSTFTEEHKDLALHEVKGVYMNSVDLRSSRLFLVQTAHPLKQGTDVIQLVLNDRLVPIQMIPEGTDFKLTYVLDSADDTNSTYRVLLECNNKLVVLTYKTDTKSMDTLFEFPLKGVRIDEDTSGRDTSVFYGSEDLEDALLFKYLTGTETEFSKLNMGL